MREYIYISDRKLESLSHLLQPRALARIRELNLSLGPVGGGVGLSEASTPTKHEVIVRYNRGLVFKFTV